MANQTAEVPREPCQSMELILLRALDEKKRSTGSLVAGPESEITNLKTSIQQLTEAHDTFACKTGAMFADVTSFVQQALAQQETRTQFRFDEIDQGNAAGCYARCLSQLRVGRRDTMATSLLVKQLQLDRNSKHDKPED